MQGVAKQGGVGGAHVQQGPQVPLGLGQVQLGEVHQDSALNDQELDEQQAVVTTHRLHRQLCFCGLQGRPNCGSALGVPLGSAATESVCW